MFENVNEKQRNAWLARVLADLPRGSRLLDAGAGEQRNRRYCGHLEYVSQDFCQYVGISDGAIPEGLQRNKWDTTGIDLISDITEIPEPDESFDAILCSEVLEHVPEPTLALDEFSRLLKPGGKLILSAPFSSNVHMAPYYFSTGFSKYWYEHHLERRGFSIESLVANGDWYSLLFQEITRLGGLERQRGNWTWPFAYIFGFIVFLYFRLRKQVPAQDLACFGWQCVAVKKLKGT